MSLLSEGNYTLGLDLGTERDHSVLVAVERAEIRNRKPVQRWENGIGLVDDEGTDTHWLVRGVKRWATGVDYVQIVAELADVIAASGTAGAQLRFDQGGVGRAVKELLRAEWHEGRLTNTTPRGMTLTAGREPGDGTIPKRDVVYAVHDALLRDRVHIAPGIAEAEYRQLRHELDAFRVEVTAAGNQRWNAATERDHDDGVIALGLCLVRKHNTPPPRTLARDYFLSHVLTGFEDQPPTVTWPDHRSGQTWDPAAGRWVR